MKVRGAMVTGTLLVANEFCDLLCARYDVTTPNPHRKCDGRGTYFDIRHALRCIKEGLNIARHDGVHDEILYLALLAFPSAAVRRYRSSTRAASYQRGRYVRGVTYWRHGLIYSPGDYGTDRLMPSSASKSGTLTRTPIYLTQCQSSWLDGRKSRRVIKVSTAKSNIFFFSVCCFC